MKTHSGARPYRTIAAMAVLLVLGASSAFAQADFIAADFMATPERQAPGVPIQFKDLSEPSPFINSWRWDFGDGQTSTARNPSHSYALAGIYTVTLTVTSSTGFEDTETKDNFITILAPPFADFTADPREGTPPLTVQFTDTSVGSANNPPVSWRWDFGDQTPIVVRQNPLHTYEEPGDYTVTLTTRFQNGVESTIEKPAYVIVAESEEPATDFSAAIMVRDQEGILPLMDYVPLFSFAMKYNDEEPTFRYLDSLVFTVTGDLIDSWDDRPYWITAAPAQEDLLDFAIFTDNPNSAGEVGSLGDEDFVLYTFNNAGAPLGTMTGGRGSLRYNLNNLIGSGSPTDPEFPIAAGGGDTGNSYIVCVRTSALWFSSLSLGVIVEFAHMYNPYGVTPEDSYPGDNWKEPVLEKIGYSASFSVYDYTSGPLDDRNVRWANAWEHPVNSYTPLSEHARPRWDLAASTFEVVFGERMGQRRMFSVETWVPLLGINAHSTTSQHEVDALRPTDVEDFGVDDHPDLREVNMVLADVGGKAGDIAGSGGFDPRKHLDPMTAEGYRFSDLGSPDNAIGYDYTYNGLWVFYDTNGNGLFDPPVPSAAGGAALTDHPLLPDILTDNGTPELADRYKERWQFVGNPPGGGDPWWKVKLRFIDGRRRADGNTSPTGFLEPVPDNQGPAHYGSEITPDYFVVFRADSGFQDASLVTGDGTGYLLGADFKAFVEPRWFDPQQGHWQGGIHVNTQIPGTGEILGDQVLSAWQDDPRWLANEPFWPQRTSNSMTTKPVRGGVEIHDYTILYDSNSRYATDTWEIMYGLDSIAYNVPGLNDLFESRFNAYMDPFGLQSGLFYYGFRPTVNAWSYPSWAGNSVNFQGVSMIVDDEHDFTRGFETAPFFKEVADGNLSGPRSPVYLFPPEQPTLPTYATWPPTLPPGRYPSYWDWAPEDRRARLLKQHVEVDSAPVPLLGINLVGADDPVVNRVNARYLNEMYVAFWGPNFTPSDFERLDPAGAAASGVQLRKDGDQNGTYTNAFGLAGITADSDPPIPLKNLAWPTNPESVDLDGDGLADDITGDGQVTAADKAWVLRIIPVAAQVLPISDKGTTTLPDNEPPPDEGEEEEEEKALSASAPTDKPVRSVLVDFNKPGAVGEALAAKAGELEETKDGLKVKTQASSKAASAEKAGEQNKALALVANAGDDMFITVRTSSTIGRFERFRAFIPATLPDRPSTIRQAGIRITPGVQLNAQALVKLSPEEGPVQDFYGHDMLEANIATKLTDLVGSGQTISRSSEPFAAVGIDVSTNRGAAGVAAQGTSGTGGEGTFTVAGAGWVANSFAGYFLVDQFYEAYEITGNTESQLSLLGEFTPPNGKWFIAKDPTFLEQVIVEIYDEGDDNQFNPLEDLLPLDAENPTESGVMIYRDNDSDPSNRNGIFDPGVDYPVPLDDDPDFIGEVGEAATQVRFVFSSPGTDDVPVPKVQQPHLRQWIPDTFAADALNDPATGPDFFVVVRTSETINTGDDFRVAVVSWGPDTPTQPDADTFTAPNVPMTHRDDLAQFLEFPWGSRALGFITFYKNPPDNSGFNWIRSTVSQYVLSNKIQASSSGGSGGTLTIASVTPSVISTTTTTATDLAITGSGFGVNPVVRLNSQNQFLTIKQANNTLIVVTIAVGATFEEGPVSVQVQNPASNSSAISSDLLTAVAGDIPDAPVISSITPQTGGQADFPVAIRGAHFLDLNEPNPAQRAAPEVYFGGRKMPVAYVSPDGTRIDVNYPTVTGLATGALDVEVRATHTVEGEKVVLKAVKNDGFYFQNSPGGVPDPCFIATAAYGTPFGQHLDTFRAFRDNVLLQTSAGTAFVDLYYSTSPALADVVAAHPWLAALVRLVLTPLAWLIEQPAGLILPGMAALLAMVRRRRARA